VHFKSSEKKEPAGDSVETEEGKSPDQIYKEELEHARE